MSDTSQFQKLHSLLEGDGSDLREQLVYAGLLLVIFERFKDYVVEHVDGFFSNHLEIENGKLVVRRSTKFKKMIEEKGKGQPGQHRNKEFRAALHWFYDLGAITQDEFSEIERLYLVRNDVGHELMRIVADDTKPRLALGEVLISFGVYVKIVRWWVKEVEIATDPDLTQEQYDKIDFDAIESSDTLFLREIIDKALADNATYKQLKDDLDKMRKEQCSD